MLSDGNARLAAARSLTDRRTRRDTGLFLAEGLQAVREALAANRVVELYATAAMVTAHPQLLGAADVVSPKAASSLSETVNPQGLVAVCRVAAVTAVSEQDRLVVVLVDASDPGNAGTIIRTADAAGATRVIFAGDCVDPYNGKCVRATAGSIFHLDISVNPQPAAVLAEIRSAGMLCLATTGHADTSLDDLVDARRLAGSTAWIFGNEAHGLPADIVAAADVAVRVPIHGQAESLNLSAAAAICLYASARAAAGHI